MIIHLGWLLCLCGLAENLEWSADSVPEKYTAAKLDVCVFREAFKLCHKAEVETRRNHYLGELAFY